ncbi:MAG: hypothetical protein LQ346_000838 [Caloplaca aetnensis]|nr:MAG: hypothetical protein LQ346_000838 [Caloplaca aetnensis]
MDPGGLDKGNLVLLPPGARSLTMLIQNTSLQYAEDVYRIREELYQLEGGAGDEIFQTRMPPLGEQMLFNVAIDLGTPEGVAAGELMVRQRLSSLLPIEQEARTATLIPPALKDDIVRHFRRMTMELPWNGDPSAPLNREDGRLDQFTDNFFEDFVCRFPDRLLRQIRPHVPTRCDLDCWIADCLVREVICEDFAIPYEDVVQQEQQKVFAFKNAGVVDGKPWALAISVVISMYLAKLSVKLAAWLPYELLIVQAPENLAVHAAFIGGGEYFNELARPDFVELPDTVLQVCLGHVLDWMESRKWHDTRLLTLEEEDHREMFWDAVDEFGRQRGFT